MKNSTDQTLTFISSGSRTIAPKENWPPTPELTLSQTLTLAGGDFPWGQLSGCPQP